MCPTKPYGFIGMSSRWSQKMFYQRKFKSLHRVRRSGKKKIWIPLERRTRVESKALKGESEEGPCEILLLPILRPFLSWIFKPPWILREVKERRRGVLHGLEGWCWWNDRGERRRWVKRWIPFTMAPRVKVGRHQSDWWQAPVRPVTAHGRASEPLSVFPTHLR
jgi:hypothetical protein